MLRTHYTNGITEKMDGEEVKIAGWVRTIRDIGKLVFVILGDREGEIQITVKKDKAPDLMEKIKKEISRESVIQVKGTVKKSKKAPGNREIIPKEIEVLNVAETPLPLEPSEKSEAELKTRLNARYMDLRRPNTGAIFKIRDTVLTAAREFLEDKGFLEIHTPRVVSTSSEGGTELFPISYFEKEAFLSQSPQLYKQMMMASGFDKVYETATYFRAEEHQTIWHLNEITAIDLEMAFIENEEDVMSVLEELVAHVIKAVKQECKGELKRLNVKLKIPKVPVPRITYKEAVKMVKKKGVDIPYGEDLSTEAEKVLGDIMKKKGYELYFITKYPIKIKPFYTMPEDELSRSFDLDYKGRELVSGSQRIHQPELLVDQIKANKMNPDDLKSYLESFQYGMPPHGGFGLGIGRFVMFLLNLPNIREAVLFPRDRKRLKP